jgi:hypothetical protein
MLSPARPQPCTSPVALHPGPDVALEPAPNPNLPQALTRPPLRTQRSATTLRCTRPSDRATT